MMLLSLKYGARIYFISSRVATNLIYFNIGRYGIKNKFE